MEQLLKVCVIGVLAVLLSLVMKKENPAGAYLVILAVGAFILYFAMSLLAPVKELLDKLSQAAGLSPAVMAPLIKTLGIAIVTKFAADSCRDAKENAVASYIELAGTAAGLYVSLPLISAVFDLITSFL